MRFTSIVSAVGVFLLWGLAGAVSFFAFVAACGVGLAASANSGTIGQQPMPWIGATLLLAGASALLLYLSLYLRARSVARAQWIVTGSLGALVAPIVAVYTFIQAILLTSATWGNQAGSDGFARDLLVEAAAPAWMWWLLVLLLGFVTVSVLLARGPIARPGEGGRRFSVYVYAVLGIIPASSVGALVTTAMLAM